MKIINLESTKNTRDLGGMRTTFNKTIKEKKLIDNGNLEVSNDYINYLSCKYSFTIIFLISSLCFTASVFNLMKNNESKKALVSTVLWAFLLGSIKGGGYLILLPLIFVLYNKDDKKKSLLTMLYILIAGLGSVLLFDVIIPAGSELFQLGVEGNGRLTASYALEHPRGFLDMTINSYIRDLDFLVLNMAGSHLARLEFAIPSVVVIMLLVLIILYAINEEDSIALHKGCKGVFWLIIMVGIISTPAMLLSWTNVGSKTIEGLQGRYYLPLLPLLYLVLTKFSLHNPMDEEQKSVVQKKIIIWYLGISCLAIFYMLRLYVTR